MALGADRSRVRNLVLREGMLTGIVGILTGLGGAFFLVRLLTELLFGVTTRDPVVFIAAPLVLLSTILLATWIPARRAASVDPMQALRNE
jgi:ABC-type antimicrobial peptide transport system permease subunit